MKDQKILLVNGDRREDGWNLPGGRMDYGEDLKIALIRKVYEETGLTINVGNAFCVSEFLYDEKEFHVVNVFFNCDISDGNIIDSWVDKGGPVIDRRFFSLAELQSANIFQGGCGMGNG